MARIFVSYNRKNIEFCKQLTDELQKRELDLWVDWEDIPPTVDWLKEIEKGVEEADTFLAIVTQEWIGSRNCFIELEYAVKNGKRLIPVVPYDIVWNDVPPDLALLNFIFFTEKFDYNTQLEKLFTALDTDYDWLKTHRRLQVKALEWERSNKEGGFLLHGKDLDKAEQQISVNANKDPNPTDIQREYVLLSRQGATRQRRITTSILGALVIVMLGIIGLLAQPYVADALAKKNARQQSPLVTIPAGHVAFVVGNTSNTAQLGSFTIEARAVTSQTYAMCTKVGKCIPPTGSPEINGSNSQDAAVVWVTVVQAAIYCDWIGRRLPTLSEWERAARMLGASPTEKDRFVFSDHYEWTSSYQISNGSQKIDGEWNGHFESLDLAWNFLHRGGELTTNDVNIYPSSSGAYGSTNNTSFRCAGK